MRFGDIDSRVVLALRKVDDLTLKRKAQWERFSLGTRRDAYSYDLASSSIVVFTKDKDGLPPYIIQIRDEDGGIVETLRTDDLTNSDPETAAFLDWAEAFYAHAKRSALRTDTVLDDLLAELEEE